MPALFSVFFTIELICLIAAFIYIRNDVDKFYKITRYYLFIVCTVEFGGRILTRIYHQHNTWLYTLFLFVEATYIAYGIYHFMKPYKIAKLPVYIAYTIFVILYLLEIFQNGLAGQNTKPILYLSVMVTLSSLWYYYLLLKSDNFVVLRMHEPFWWIAGILLFYFGGIVITLFEPIFNAKIHDNHTLRYYIFILLNLILYSFWTYSFICRKRQRKYMH